MAGRFAKKQIVDKNSTTIKVGFVAPNTTSEVQVGSGLYSLNKRSNVPFVTFVGASGFTKTITWGEFAEIPEGALVSVRNASYHGGDIFLNKGMDPCNRPSRITVPVTITLDNVIAGSALLYAGVEFPVDTRGAKRAFINFDCQTSEETAVNVRGRRLDGSMKTANPLGVFAAPYGPGVGYVDQQLVPAGDTMAMIPLGQGAMNGSDLPHSLLDACDVFIVYSTPPAFNLQFTFPVVPVGAVATGVLVTPPAWYVVEYD